MVGEAKDRGEYGLMASAAEIPPPPPAPTTAWVRREARRERNGVGDGAVPAAEEEPGSGVVRSGAGGPAGVLVLLGTVGGGGGGGVGFLLSPKKERDGRSWKDGEAARPEALCRDGGRGGCSGPAPAIRAAYSAPVPAPAARPPGAPPPLPMCGGFCLGGDGLPRWWPAGPPNRRRKMEACCWVLGGRSLVVYWCVHSRKKIIHPSLLSPLTLLQPSSSATDAPRTGGPTASTASNSSRRRPLPSPRRRDGTAAAPEANAFPSPPSSSSLSSSPSPSSSSLAHLLIAVVAALGVGQSARRETSAIRFKR